MGDVIMWAEPFLLGIAALSLSATGFSAILISLALTQSTEPDKAISKDRPAIQGAWLTVLNFFFILTLSLEPLLAFYFIQEANLQFPPTTVWRVISGIAALHLIVGALMMTRTYRRQYAKGRVLYSRQIIYFMTVGVVLLIVLISISILNFLIGSGALYLALLSLYLFGILIWTGMVMFYAQSSTQKSAS